MTSFTKCKSKITVFIFGVIFITNITSCYGLSACEKFNIGYSTFALHNLSIPTISIPVLENQMDMVEYFYEIKPCTNLTFKVTEIPPTVNFIVLQTHSHLYDVALGYSPLKKGDQKVIGTNVGLVQIVDKTGTAAFNLENKHVFSVSVLLAVLYYGHNVPLPGGCNLEFEVEISPFMKLHYTSSLIEVDAQPAKIPKSWISSYNRPCTPEQLQYETYLLYLPQNDFSEESYFNGIRRMLSVKRIKQNGRKVIAPSGQLRSRYSTYYGTGVIYAMVVTASNLDHAAYVPIHTYSCSPEFNSDKCFNRSFFSMLSCFLLGVSGIFLCFFGNRLSGQELVVMFGLFVAIIVYILLTMVRDSAGLSNQGCVAIAIISGLIISEIFLSIVKMCNIAIIDIAYLVDVVVLGVLLASAVFYSPIGDYSIFDNSQLYWILYCIIVVFVPIVSYFYLFDKTVDRLAPAIVGAYAMVLCLEYFVYSNLRYIIVNPIRQATVEGFHLATIAPPYQTVDLIMILVWTGLSVLGFLFQPNKSFPNSPERNPILNRITSNNYDSMHGICTDSNNESVFFSDSEPVETTERDLLVY